MGYFIKGVLLGFSIAAPVGPIGILCIQRTLAKGRLAGLCTGLGAATADGVYGAIAAFGLTTISAFLLGYKSWLHIIGGYFLLYLGARIFFTPPASEHKTTEPTGYLYDYCSTVLLTLTNPMTILSFMAVFAGMGLGGGTSGYADASCMTLGVITGSAAWWVVLSCGIGWLKGRWNQPFLIRINQLSGIIIIGFGIAALVYH